MLPTVLAIDVGSNAVRSAIAEICPAKGIRVLHEVRLPVRLGKDVFASGAISKEYIDLLIRAFKQIHQVIQTQRPVAVRAVATSALREALNGREVIKMVQKATGIKIDVIDGLEEARLIHLAIDRKCDLQKKSGFLFDIGGGSVEITLVQNGQILAANTFPIGTVRMLNLMQQKGLSEADLPKLIEAHLQQVKSFLKDHADRVNYDVCIGTGGNVKCFGRLRKLLLRKSKSSMVTFKETKILRKGLMKFSYAKRISKIGLREDRADVIIPAAIVIENMLKLAKTSELQVPNVGLKDGVLLDLARTFLKNR